MRTPGTFRRNPLLHLIDGWDYWRSRRDGDALPGRSDIRPDEIMAMLPHVMLIDVQRDPWDFRYRLVGTRIAEKMHHDRTGEWFSTTAQTAADSRAFRRVRHVAETAVPISGVLSYFGPSDDFLELCDLVCPLASDGRTVDMIFSVSVFVPKIAEYDRTILRDLPADWPNPEPPPDAEREPGS